MYNTSEQTRYYDPEIGRFISPDSTKYLDPETIHGLNLYAYCLNNPVMLVDPSGNSPYEWYHWAAIALGGALIITASLMAILGTGGVAAFGIGALIGSVSVGAVGAGAGAAIGYAIGGTDGALQGLALGFGIGAGWVGYSVTIDIDEISKIIFGG